jgi:hypothetical protein
LQGASFAVPGILQRLGGDYQGRLSVQETELVEKAERSVKKLAIVAEDDAATGETTYAVAEKELAAFWDWLRDAEEKWREHNETLLVDRATEALAVHLEELPSVRFVVAAPKLARRALPQPELRGYSVPTPGMMEAVGRTWKTAASVTGSLTILSFFLTSEEGVSQLRPLIIGGVFVVTLVVAGLFTVPRERRQQRNRLLAKAQEACAREVLDAVRARVRESSDAQLRAIRGHLASEGERWKAVTRKVDTGEMPIVSMATGLSQENRTKLDGEWVRAIEARLKELAPPPQTSTVPIPGAGKGKTQLIG